MKVLVVGQGGREHALTWKLASSPSVSQIFCAPGNAGTALEGTNVDISVNDIERLRKFASAERIDLTVVGPEAALVGGIVDVFENADLKIFGPSSQAAELEGSKVFSKELMRRANVPTAESHVFNHVEDAQKYIEDREEQPLVVKADGLAAGKGVTVCGTRDEALQVINKMMVDQEFGDAGNRVIIEEFLDGEEASILAIVDGRTNTIVPLATSQDYKCAYDGDQGPNTGGMGACSPATLVTNESMDDIIEKILVPTIHTMNVEGRPFCGILYAGLMITSQGPKVLEFNVRFGDPEAQPILMRLKSDLAEILMAAAIGELGNVPPLDWDPRPTTCVVMASDGYPGSYKKGHPIYGLHEADKLDNVQVFHAGTKKRGEQFITNGGRVLGVTAIGDNIADAKFRAYQGVKCIRWAGAWCRKDISNKSR